MITEPARPAAYTYPYHSTRELIEVNRTYLREYEADPTPGKLAAVIRSSEELTRRGA